MDKNHPDVKFGKTGVLLINLGTPDSTSWWDIRKYLKEFLSDRRVIEVNPIVWQIILNLFILTFRPSKTAHAYKKIWRKESNESPLLYFTIMSSTISINTVFQKHAAAFASEYATQVVTELANKHNFDPEEAMRDLGINNLVGWCCKDRESAAPSRYYYNA